MGTWNPGVPTTGEERSSILRTPPQVDELDLVAAVDDVGGLHVAVQQTAPVQVVQRVEDLQAVGGHVLGPQRAAERMAASARLPLDLLQGLPDDVLHHDVVDELAAARVGVPHEVPDADDVGVVELDQRFAFGVDQLPGTVGVRVDQSLDRDEVADPLVLGEVDPAQPAAGQGPGDPVLVADQFVLAQRRLRGGLLGGARRPGELQRVAGRHGRQHGRLVDVRPAGTDEHAPPDDGAAQEGVADGPPGPAGRGAAAHVAEAALVDVPRAAGLGARRHARPPAFRSWCSLRHISWM